MQGTHHATNGEQEGGHSLSIGELAALPGMPCETVVHCSYC